MKISYKHLVNLIKENPSIEEISDKLFQLGHENRIINEILILNLHLIEVIAFQYMVY